MELYEKEKLDTWIKNANDNVFKFLKQRILICKDKYKYEVNFPREFKILIREAKHLDTLGYQLPKTILNIALQEKEYFKYVDKLSKMIEEYHSVINSMDDIEKNLFADHLESLTNGLNPALNSFNLNTLGIFDFI